MLIGNLNHMYAKVRFMSLLVFFTAFISFQGFSQNSQTYTSSGTFTVPVGVTQITVEAWGGGGGGSADVGAGGGGGAYSKSDIIVTPGNTYNVIVGARGAGGTIGGIGGNSIFGNNIVIAAGAQGKNGGLAVNSIGSIAVFSGGNGGNGGGNSGGGGGGSAYTNSDGNGGGDGGGNSGGAGGIGTGNGGQGGGNKTKGDSGNEPGGGGGGSGNKTNSGGDGAAGQIIISWCQLPSINSQPVDQTITYGSNALFTVSSGTPGVTYQWQVSNDNGSNWADLENEESATLNVASPTVAMSGYQYRCIVFLADCGFSTSDVATLTVNRKTLIVTAGNQTVSYGTHNGIITQNGTYTISGFITGDNSSLVSGLNTISYSTNYTETTDAATSGVTITTNLSGLSAANYYFTDAPGIITIEKSNQVINTDFISFTQPLNEFTGEVPVVANSTSGLPVIITMESGSAADLNEDPQFNYYLTNIGQTGTVTLYYNQPGNANFNAATEVVSVIDVTKSNQSISFPAINDVAYLNGLTIDLNAVASSGQAVTYTIVSGPATLTGNTLNITGTGEVIVRASQDGYPAFNPATDVTRAFTVNKGTQSITINIGPGAISSSTQVTAISSSGLPVALALGPGSDATALVDQGTYYTLAGLGSIGSGFVYLVGNQGGNANFLPASQVVETIDLSKQNQSITFSPIADQTYSPSLSVSLSANASSGLPVSYTFVDGPATLSGSTLSITGTGTVVVEANQLGDETYNPAPVVTQQFEILKATPVINQANLNVNIADLDFTLTPSSESGGVFSFSSGDDDIVTISGNLVTIVGAGTTGIYILQEPTANYNGTTKVLSITVNNAPSSIVVTGVTSYVYNAGHQGPETSAVTGSTGAVTYSYEGIAPTNYGPSAMKPINVGNYAVIANVAADNNYASATSAPYNFTINKADALISVTPYTVEYTGLSQTSVGSVTGVAGESLAGLDLSATIHTDAGNYNDAWIFTDVTGNYNDYTGSVNSVINPKTLEVTANDQAKCFGEFFNFSGTEFSTTGLVSGETITSVSLSSTGDGTSAAIGDYAITPTNATGVGFNPANYSITYEDGMLTVKPLPSLTAVNQAATVCDGTNATINLSGLLPGKIFTLDYTIEGGAISTITGLNSDASGNSSFTIPLTIDNDAQILTITGITITSETPNCSQSFSESVTLSVNPLPMLTSATQSGVACDGTSALINLAGLLPNTTFSVDYSIDSVDQTTIDNILADASGNASFNTPVLSTINDGQILQITGLVITSETPNCVQPFSENVVLQVGDNMNPTITCPVDQTGIFDTNCEFILPNYTGLASVTDNCDANPMITQLPATGTTIGETTTITLTATDASGNAANCTFDVTLIPAEVIDIQVEDLGNSCQSGETGSTTTVAWDITKITGTNDWTFDYEITEDAIVLTSESNVAANGNTQVSFDADNETAQSKTYTIAISNVQDACGVGETNTINNSDSVTLDGVPDTSDIITD